MKQAPARVCNFEEALQASVLEKPFIYFFKDVITCRVLWSYLVSASRARNIKAYNFCVRMNEMQELAHNETS